MDEVIRQQDGHLQKSDGHKVDFRHVVGAMGCPVSLDHGEALVDETDALGDDEDGEDDISDLSKLAKAFKAVLPWRLRVCL